MFHVKQRQLPTPKERPDARVAPLRARSPPVSIESEGSRSNGKPRFNGQNLFAAGGASLRMYLDEPLGKSAPTGEQRLARANSRAITNGAGPEHQRARIGIGRPWRLSRLTRAAGWSAEADALPAQQALSGAR